MGLYKVMLVDDEEEVRQAIEKRINWEEIGFSVVARAENGNDALELALEYQPDVVMTDIHMPFMTGLEFAKKLKEILPATKIVIFSGYDDFEYAKEAIKLEAEEYILKPIDSEELKGVFSRIKLRLDDEFDRRTNLEKLEKYYQDSVPFLKEQFLVSILEGRIGYEYFDLNFKTYGLDLTSNYYSVGILKLSFDNTEDAKNIENQQLLSISLNQLVNEKLKENEKLHITYYLGRTVVLGLMDTTDEYASFVSMLDRLCKLSAKVLGCPTTAGVGNTVDTVEDISISYKQADEALNYRNLYDENQAFCIADVEPKWLSVDALDDRVITDIIKQIKIGTKEDLVETIKNALSRIEAKNIAIYQIELTLVEIYFEVIRLIKGYDLQQEQLSLLEFDVYAKIKSLTTFEAMGNWLTDYCLQVRGFIRQERKDSTKLLMENAIEYIKEHFCESDISVDTLCNYLGVSQTYFSTLFKKHTGVSFVTYLTNIRMEKAIELLNTTDEKSYVIAGLIGYDEPNYFSYVFKKAYGISPSKYRQQRES